MKQGYSAKVLAHSISPDGITLKTLEIEYPRFILAEVNTHRMLSKNSASSRAIPASKLIDMITNSPAMPVYWGKNQKGMSASEEVDDIGFFENLWLQARDFALKKSEEMSEGGLHKQLANRVTEPYCTMKTVISGTQWDNFFHLRDHPAAQPEFRYLAHLMRTTIDSSNPVALGYGEWHLPYVHSARDSSGRLCYYDTDMKEVSLEDARIISSSCCAQVSYRNLNDSLDKCKEVYSRLVESTPCHASPVEHQATPINMKSNKMQEGITHMTKDGMLWSANFKGWVQFRHLIPNESV